MHLINLLQEEIFLHFGAAKAAIEVYVNGNFVGYGQGSMTPHEFNVTKYLRYDEENVIAAKVYRYSDGTYLEDQDMWWLCGIYREVYLLQKALYPSEIFISRTKFDNFYNNATALLDIEIKNYWAFNGNASIEAKLISPNGSEIVLGSSKISLEANSADISDL